MSAAPLAVARIVGNLRSRVSVHLYTFFKRQFRIVLYHEIKSFEKKMRPANKIQPCMEWDA